MDIIYIKGFLTYQYFIPTIRDKYQADDKFLVVSGSFSTFIQKFIKLPQGVWLHKIHIKQM